MYNIFILFVLFVHTYRVFSDRLIDDKDREAFVQTLSEKLGSLFDQTFHNICPNKQPPIFGESRFKIFYFLYVFCTASSATFRVEDTVEPAL